MAERCITSRSSKVCSDTAFTGTWAGIFANNCPAHRAPTWLQADCSQDYGPGVRVPHPWVDTRPAPLAHQTAAGKLMACINYYITTYIVLYEGGLQVRPWQDFPSCLDTHAEGNVAGV